MLAPRPPRRNFNFGGEPHRRAGRGRRVLVTCTTATVIFATAFYIGGPTDQASPEATSTAGACSVTPTPDSQGSFYGTTQLFTLRAVGKQMAVVTKELAISILPSGGYSVEVDGVATAPSVQWRTESEKDLQHTTSDVFVPLPEPLRGGWDLYIDPNPYSPAGYVATVRTDC
jgi:hypothetical protein